MADELSSHSLTTVTTLGIAKNQEDAAARKRNCSWILTLWRRQIAADTPNYSSPLEAGSDTKEIVDNRPPGGTLLGYSLREAGSRKNIAWAESEDHAPFAKWASQIAKKIGKDRVNNR
ncbi:MAG TPA: hypothetical protein VHX37_04845 [Acidobacteriaceae bacterium]|jgi:hypothetical protein|nr:hypothetical protein [Acidobacteriaceae bacterium]